MDNYLFKAYVVNAFEYDNGNKETSGTWIYFPASDSEIGDALKQIGLSDHAKTEKYFIDGYVCHLKAIEPLLNIDADVYELDKTARLLATLSDFELQKLGAVMETGARFETLTQVREFARNVDYFQFEL